MTTRKKLEGASRASTPSQGPSSPWPTEPRDVLALLQADARKLSSHAHSLRGKFRGNLADAEDVVADQLATHFELHLAGRLKGLDYGAYFRRCLRNRYLDLLRSKGREADGLELLAAELGLGPDRPSTSGEKP